MVTPNEIKEIAFLRNLSEEHRSQIAEIASLNEYDVGAIVFSQGQGALNIYVVLSGEIGLQAEVSGELIEISRLGPGELLGWSPALGRGAMTATARAVTRCRLCVLDSRSVLELCERNPHLGVAFLREIALAISDRLWGARRNLARALSHRPLFAGTPESSE